MQTSFDRSWAEITDLNSVDLPYGIRDQLKTCQKNYMFHEIQTKQIKFRQQYYSSKSFYFSQYTEFDTTENIWIIVSY